MNLRHIFAYFVAFLTGITAFAGPAGKSPVYLKQPDGTTFQASIKGDEFVRIKTTATGQAVIQDSDGWWCYAIYSEDGTKASSGWRVGEETPADVISASSRIPYLRLSQSAMEHRKASYEFIGEPIFRKMKALGKAMTKAGSEPVTKHALVILAEFKDVPFDYSREDFISLLTEEGYSVNGATGSAKEYFDDQFNGLLEFEFHVADIVTLPKDRSYYGGNGPDGDDKKPAEMIRDACKLADSEIDFSIYDDDNDGEVDNVFIFFAGEDEAEGGAEECIWSHSWYIYSGARIDLELDGTRIDRYACASELMLIHDQQGNTNDYISGIGTFCHEYSHTLGLPDFYDTDYEESGGISAGLWLHTSLMDGGNYNNMGNTPPYYNAIERMIVGISEPEMISETGTYRLSPVNKDRSYLVRGASEGKFFLLEYRSSEGWDAHLGGSGLLAYQIDTTDSNFMEWLAYNEVNINPEHQKADLLEADGRPDSFQTMDDFHSYRTDLSGIFFPYNETDMIETDMFTISGIRKEDNNIKFNFISGDGVQLPPYATNIVKDVFADAAIIGFESSHSYSGEATVAWGRTDSPKDTLRAMPYEPGKYAVVLDSLESAGKTYEIDILFIKDGMEGETVTTSIMTKRMPSVKWPYIYLGSVERNGDGTFPMGAKLPLRVYGATSAKEIGWTINDMPISIEGDGYYTLKHGGTLRAIIFWEDGSVDKVEKQINISEE